MHVMGKWNWWAPKPLVKLHGLLGISEDGGGGGGGRHRMDRSTQKRNRLISKDS
jgi:hypothetical protein